MVKLLKKNLSLTNTHTGSLQSRNVVSLRATCVVRAHTMSDCTIVKESESL